MNMAMELFLNPLRLPLSHQDTWGYLNFFPRRKCLLKNSRVGMQKENKWNLDGPYCQWPDIGMKAKPDTKGH